MEIYEMKQFLTEAKDQIASIRGLFDLDRLEEDIADYENQMLAPDFWDDNDQAQETVAVLNQAKETYQTFNQLEDQVEELDMALALYSEDGDGEILHEAQDLVDHLSQSLSDYQTQLLLSGDHDGADAILEIHPGAGGRSLKIGGLCSLECINAGLTKKVTALR